jgi:hypothetical protein
MNTSWYEVTIFVAGMACGAVLEFLMVILMRGRV